LDEDFKKTGQLKGPLHGVPMSIKDQFDISGYDSSIGFTSWCNSPASSDAGVVEAVRKAGAVIICKTNVPQTMLNFECSNPVWGTSTNPWNSAYTCGGSSGGEGCVLGTDATALGIGSDVGGSLRIPALFCGAYSLKPGTGRVSNRGARSSNPGFDTIKTTPGPMGRSVEDVERLSRVLFSSTPENDFEGIAPVPYRDVELPSKLRFGYYFEDGFIRTSPANRRAVQETVDALEKAGHEVVKFELPFGPQSIQIFAALTSADGYRTLMSPGGGDPVERNLFLITIGPKLFRWLQTTVVWFINDILKDPLFATAFSMSRHSNLTRFWKNNAWMMDITQEFYSLVWDKYQFDAIIAPGMACPALPHGATTTLSPLANGTFYYNIIDSPVGAIPVTRVTPEDVITEEWKAAADVPKGEANPSGGSWILNGGLYGRNGSGGVYDPVRMEGLPVGTCSALSILHFLTHLFRDPSSWS
jgi:amidase